MKQSWVAAAVAAMMVMTAPVSSAQVRYWTVDVVVAWSSRTCVELVEPDSYDRSRLLSTQACRSNGTAATTYVVSTGEYYGVDPIMGDNQSLYCAVSLNGGRVYVDYGVAGDGTDINCLGIAP